MTGILGYRIVNEAENRTRVSVGGDGAGHSMDIVVTPDGGAGINGLGTVHHVAMAIATDEQQRWLRAELLQMGLHVTEVRDRCYFQSIYFREPAVCCSKWRRRSRDSPPTKDLPDLGRGLKLPPWEEQYRPSIEANLAPIRYR
jgi:glyoxalase family protein